MWRSRIAVGEGVAVGGVEVVLRGMTAPDRAILSVNGTRDTYRLPYEIEAGEVAIVIKTTSTYQAIGRQVDLQVWAPRHVPITKLGKEDTHGT